MIKSVVLAATCVVALASPSPTPTAIPTRPPIPPNCTRIGNTIQGSTHFLLSQNYSFFYFVEVGGVTNQVTVTLDDSSIQLIPNGHGVMDLHKISVSALSSGTTIYGCK